LVQHLGQRHALGAAAVLDEQVLGRVFGGWLVALGLQAPRLSARPRAGARRAPAWSGSPPRRVEGLHGVLGVGGDEDHHRRAPQGAQVVGQARPSVPGMWMSSRTTSTGSREH
jgi:hypothetical protein